MGEEEEPMGEGGRLREVSGGRGEEEEPRGPREGLHEAPEEEGEVLLGRGLLEEVLCLIRELINVEEHAVEMAAQWRRRDPEASREMAEIADDARALRQECVDLLMKLVGAGRGGWRAGAC